MVAPPVSDHVDQSFIRNIVHIPRNFISMSFNDHPEFGLRIDHTYSGTVIICDEFINIGF